MEKDDWRLAQPINAVVFDCDGTLSHIEGIDALAAQAGVEKAVSVLTEQAMSVTGITPEIYAERMKLVKPNLHQLVELGQQYFERRVEDVEAVIRAFLSVNKAVYIISAGLNPAVKIFGALIGIPEENVFAVDVICNEAGAYLDYDHDAPTANAGGKRKILEALIKIHPRILFVGDGMNDVEASEVVERFVGFGGYRFRENIAKYSDFYIKVPSFASLLPLGLMREEIETLSESELRRVKQGLDQLENGDVIIPRVN